MGLNIEKAGAADRGVMIGITGQSGAGKTTLASTFPAPLVLDLEGGAHVLAEQGTPVFRDWKLMERKRHEEFVQVLRAVASEVGYKTLVIDSWTRLSEWIEADILEEDGSAQSLMSAMGGYGKGRDAHVARTAKVIEALQWLQDNRNLNVVLILHTKIGQVDLPTGESYSHFGTEGVKASTTRVLMACDLVGQLQQRITVIDQTKNDAGKARGTGERELFVGSAPYSDTKSRYHKEPTRLPVAWGSNPLADVTG